MMTKEDAAVRDRAVKALTGDPKTIADDRREAAERKRLEFLDKAAKKATDPESKHYEAKHARRTLKLFGRSADSLEPWQSVQLSKEQRRGKTPAEIVALRKKLYKQQLSA